ncbi:MAG TPA: late competence development ComFB family protein [Anaerovoracaceae bacterium]|nr:late competence development ComFB family protein [Anaerovoracaceae bacterium]
MAKKSNKTEHVLRLITKNDEAAQEDDFFSIDHEIYENGTSAVRKVVQAEPESRAEETRPKLDGLKEKGTEKAGKAAPAVTVQQPTPAVSEKRQSTAEPPAAPFQEPPIAASAAAAAHQGSPLVRSFREQENSQPAVPDQSGALVNIAEVLARERIALVMERMKVCTCRTCYNDVLALTLNALPTKYVTTGTGKQHFQRGVYKERYETDILAALTKACVRVKASPRH